MQKREQGTSAWRHGAPRELLDALMRAAAATTAGALLEAQIL